MNNLLTLTPAEFCAATDACKEGHNWAITQPTMADVWDNCPRGDWLLWLAQRVNAADGRTLRLFAVWCARSTPLGDGRVTGDLLTDPRLLAALDVAERHANGQATAEELATARANARAANAESADYALMAAAAATAASADYAADASASVSDAVAHRARVATDARLAQADQFRMMVKNPFPRTEAQS